MRLTAQAIVFIAVTIGRPGRADPLGTLFGLLMWVLGFQEDVGTLKVELVHRYISAVDKSAVVKSFPTEIRDQSALSALMECSTIFGCVDNDGARLILSELAAAYEATLIDSASEIIPADETRAFDFGGRVVVARPGDYCLSCARELDFEEAKAALESDAVRAVREAHGYGLGHLVESPSVVSLNGVISNLAVNEFMSEVTGIRRAVRKVTYYGKRGVAVVSTDEGSKSCYTCHALRGLRDKADILRYALDAMPLAAAN